MASVTQGQETQAVPARLVSTQCFLAVEAPLCVLQRLAYMVEGGLKLIWGLSVNFGSIANHMALTPPFPSLCLPPPPSASNSLNITLGTWWVFSA